MDVHSYKKRRWKYFELPSGFQIKVKSLSPYTILQIREGEKNTDFDIYTKNIIDKLFHEFIVEPIIGEQMQIEDFDTDDYNAIVGLLVRQVTLGKAKEIKELKESEFGMDFSG